MKDQFEIIKKLLIKDRSIRRFDENFYVPIEVLHEIVSLTRYCASGRNLQPLKYKIINSREKCERIFPHLKWAGYLTDWDGPKEGERPTAYIIQCLDLNLTKNCLCDEGLQLQAITLGATAMELGCCIIKSFDIVKIIEENNLPEQLQPVYIVAIGKPAEQVQIVDINDNDVRYYRDVTGIHYVPKRSLKELLI